MLGRFEEVANTFSFFMIFLVSLVALAVVAAATATVPPQIRAQSFVRVAGVDPVLRPTTPGGGGQYIEMGDIVKDFETYYMYFHGSSLGGVPSYSIGVATAPSPLGPWKMHAENPILRADQPWEGGSVAMGSVVKMGVSGDIPAPPLRLRAPSLEAGAGELDRSAGIPPDPVTNKTFYLWYCTGAAPAGGSKGMVGTGLATAPHPLGPWTKWAYSDGRVGGPVLNLTGAGNFPFNREGDYNSQVVELKNGSLLMYGEAMAGPGSAGQREFQEYLGGVGIWRSDAGPPGPFSFVGFGPGTGGYGSWNDGGTSGGSVRETADGTLEMWFSGSRMRKNGRILPREEDAGVAYSSDGVHWESAVSNPQLRHDMLPGPVSALAEVHWLYEHPFRYVYHTLRWLSDDEDKEDLGVEVMLTTADAAAGWRLELPVIAGMGPLAPPPGNPELRCGCPDAACAHARAPGCIDTEHIHKVAFTARFDIDIPETLAGTAQLGYNLSVALYPSLDGSSFDSAPCTTLVMAGIVTRDNAAAQERSTHAVDVTDFAGRFLNVVATTEALAANLSTAAKFKNFELVATLIAA